MRMLKGVVTCLVLVLVGLACSWSVEAQATRVDAKGHHLPIYAIPGGTSAEIAAIQPTTNPTCFALYGRCMPYFFIVGTFKSGTTSLYLYISKHPNVQVNVQDESVDEMTTTADGKTNQIVRVKEVGFFNRPISNNEYDKQPELEVNKNKKQKKAKPGGLSSIFQYLTVFPEIFPEDNMITGEGTPNYMPSPHAPGLLFDAVSYGRFINIMREPIYRGYSRMSHLWTMMCIKGRGSTLICDEDVLPTMFDVAVDLIFDDYKLCITEHWTYDEDLIDSWSNEEVDKRYKGLNTCSRSAINKATNKIKNKSKKKLKDAQNAVKKAGAAVGRNLLGAPVETPEVALQRLKNSPSFVQFVSQSVSRCMLHHSVYSPQIHNYARYFSDDQFLNIIAEELYTNPEDTMALVAKHLSLPAIDWSEIVASKYNVGFDTGKEKAAGFTKTEAKKSVHIITPATRQKLEEFFAPLNLQVGRFVDHPHLRAPGSSPWKNVYDVK